MIHLEGVGKTFKNGFTAVRNVSLHVSRGETLSLIGTSGCGKTTTLKMINGLVKPTEGRVLVGELDVSACDPIRLRRGIGYVIQRIGLLPHRTVADNVSLLMRLEKWSKDRIRERVEELLRTVGLDPEPFWGRYPSELSGGQQQRVGVARALALDPAVVLMDEPFGALDPISRRQIQEEFLRIRSTVRKTIMMVTHDLDEAFRLSDRVALMHEGEIVYHGTPADFRSPDVPPFVREFMQKQEAGPSVLDLPVAYTPLEGGHLPGGDVPSIQKEATMKAALELFLREPALAEVAVREKDGTPLGILKREGLLDAL